MVAAGVISALNRADGRVTVTLEANGVSIGSERNELTELVRRALDADQAVTGVRVQWRLPRSDAGPPGVAGRVPRPMTPLQAELLGEGVLPEPDVLGRSRSDPRGAEGAGYHDGIPSPLPGPAGTGSHGRYEGDVPVFQWEIDPLDPARPVGEADVERDGWEHRIWWQVHPRGLVYASIQAMAAMEAPGSSSHLLGRAVAVNLVYDLERPGVVAVYGTAGDFRPFVSVFLEAYAAHAGTSEGEPRDMTHSAAEAEDEREETG